MPWLSGMALEDQPEATPAGVDVVHRFPCPSIAPQKFDVGHEIPLKPADPVGLTVTQPGDNVNGAVE
jgi:hypothetical protein